MPFFSSSQPHIEKYYFKLTIFLSSLEISPQSPHQTKLEMFYYLNFTMTASYFNQKKGNSQRQNGFVFLKSHSLEGLVYARAQQHTTRPFSPFSKLVNSIFKLAIFLSFEEISLQSLQQTKPQMFYYSNFIMTTPYFNKKKGNS